MPGIKPSFADFVQILAKVPTIERKTVLGGVIPEQNIAPREPSSIRFISPNYVP
jgi:hypothetical protein